MLEPVEVIGGDLVSFDALGLQRPQFSETAMESALDASVVASETIELLLQHLILEYLGESGLAGARFGFHAANPTELPRCAENLIEQSLLDGSPGIEINPIFIGEQVEVGLLLRTDENVLSAESVGLRIHGGARFAGGRDGAGALLGIGLVRDLLC